MNGTGTTMRVSRTPATTAAGLGGLGGIAVGVVEAVRIGVQVGVDLPTAVALLGVGTALAVPAGACTAVVALAVGAAAPAWVLLGAGVAATVSIAVGSALVSGSASAALAVVAVAATGVVWWGLRARPRAAWIGLVTAGAIGAAFVASGRAWSKIAAAPGSPSVLVVTLDGARADRFGVTPDALPAWQRLVAGGVRFELAVAPSNDAVASARTLLGGPAPWDEGATRPGLATQLAARGYATAAFVSSPDMVAVAEEFELVDLDTSGLGVLGRTAVGRLVARVVSADARRPATWTARDAIAWLDRQARPTMLWVHLADARPPYEPPPPYDERFYAGGDPRDPLSTELDGLDIDPRLRGDVTDLDYLVARYDGALAYADAAVGELFDWIEARGAADSTVVVVAGTAGTNLGEAGHWFDGLGLSDATLRVPLVLHHPRALEATVFDGPVELGDVAPSVLDLVGMAPVVERNARSLVEVVLGSMTPRLFARSVGEGASSVRGVQDRYTVGADGEATWWREERGRLVPTTADVGDPYVGMLDEAARALWTTRRSGSPSPSSP